MKYYTVEGRKKSIFKVFAIYYICMALFCLVRIFSTFDGLFPDGLAGEVVFSCIIQIGVLFVVPFVLYSVMIKVKPNQILEHCNFFKINIAVILISIGLGILCFIINIAVSSLFNGVMSFFGYRFGSSGGEANYSTGNFFLQIFITAILPAVCEEFLHRGILLQGIKHIGFKRAIIISSLLFALLHFNVQQVFYAFVVGLIMGFVSVVAKNIFPAMIIHFVNNAIATYLDFASHRGWAFGNILDKLNHFLTSNTMIFVFVIVAIVMIVVVALLCLLIWLLYKQTIIRNVNKAVNEAYSDLSIFTHNRPIHVTDE